MRRRTRGARPLRVVTDRRVSSARPTSATARFPRIAHSGGMDRGAAEQWIRVHVTPSSDVKTAHERPWSTVLRVPLTDGAAWFKACGPVQAYEPRLTAQLSARWPDRVPEVLAYDEDRAWLLVADAGKQIAALGNPPESWVAVLPLYAELQRGEAAHADAHLSHHVPDLRVAMLATRYDDLLRENLPLESAEVDELRRFAPRFEELCAELADCNVPETIQHDDLHMNNVYARDGHLRVLDWGDASVSHPFVSLVATFRFLEDRNKLAPDDPWFGRLRDAYLEPWDGGLTEVFNLAMRVGLFAHAIASVRQRVVLAGRARDQFDEDFAVRLRRALARIGT
jgi:phosphotransferase family enzyme